MASTNVVTYLTTRLQQLGVNHLFSVPGDYTSDLLEIVDTQTTLKRIGNCNELNAGYAADGYARINGLGAVAVTTGVGSFSLLNAIGGAFVEDSPVVAIIGTLSNNLGLISDIDVSRSMVKAGNELYVQVSLSNLLDALLALIDKNGYIPKWSTPVPPSAPTPPNASDTITYDGFYSVLDSFITPNHIIMADIGLSTFGGTSSLKITRPNGIQAQNIWASIGWSVPAGLGASFVDGTRALVIVGDGAFKLTCQAVSTMVMEKRNTVVFVMNNKVYGVEQMLLDPAPYKKDSTEPFEEANILQEWDYVSLMKAFSNNSPNGLSANVNTVQDLHNVLETINNNPNAAFLVNINLNERDYPSAWSLFVNK